MIIAEEPQIEEGLERLSAELGMVGSEAAPAVARTASILEPGGNRLLEVGEAESFVVYEGVNLWGGRYFGMTGDIVRRAAEHARTTGLIINPIPRLGYLSRFDARAVEQVLIERAGLENLVNRINSIATSNPNYEEAIRRGEELLRLLE